MIKTMTGNNITNTFKNLLHSPFGIAAIAGVMDLTGGLIATISDIAWLVFDTMIKTNEMGTHYMVYGSILIGLIWAAIHLTGGLLFTLYCYKKYKDNGLESHERKLTIKHITECNKQRLARSKVFK